MAVTLTPGVDRQKKAGTYQLVQDVSQSTATAVTDWNGKADVVTLAGGTATGFSRNIVRFPTAGVMEGQQVDIVQLATGETIVQFAGTATGALVFSVANQWATLKYLNAGFKVLFSGATLATATS